jgi:hypothetical protein
MDVGVDVDVRASKQRVVLHCVVFDRRLAPLRRMYSR